MNGASEESFSVDDFGEFAEVGAESTTKPEFREACTAKSRQVGPLDGRSRAIPRTKFLMFFWDRRRVSRYPERDGCARTTRLAGRAKNLKFFRRLAQLRNAA
jgi:hypothetical protein